MVDILIDSREQFKQYFYDELTALGHKCEIGKLDAGDFLLYGKTEEEAIIIERKDDSDFLGSIEGNMDKTNGVWQEGRIWDQCKRMTETGLRRYILIEGNIYSKRLSAYRKKGFKKVRIWGSLDGIRKYNISIHTVKKKAESIEWLSAMITRQKSPKKVYSLRVSAPKKMEPHQKQEYLLQGLPGIGPKASKLILDEYKTPMRAFNLIDEWILLKGIGSTMVKNCKKVLQTSETLK